MYNSLYITSIMKKSIFVLFLSISAFSFSQVASVDWPNLIPPSPTIASLEKFSNYPIGYNNGTVGISVPLYTFRLGKGLDLNIGLDYHSSGIKVNDVCGIVGTGWDLSAGGYISREIRGLPDEQIYSGFYNYMKKHIGHVFSSNTFASMDTALFDSITMHRLDPEPDLFSLDILGRKYKFFIARDGNFHTIPYSNIKFQANPLGSSTGQGTWDIVDESGNHFVFDITETTESKGKSHATAWRLTQVASVEGNTLVTFDYAYVDQSYPDATSRTNAFELFSSVEFSLNTKSETKKTPYLGLQEQTSYYSCYGSNLKKITIPGTGVLVLDAVSSGGNLPWKLLTTLKFYTPNNALKTTYNFNYFQTAFRAYLSKITKTDNSNQSINYRTFTYYPDLPGRGSYSQDYWGYYNGAGNSTLFPYIAKTLGSTPHPEMETANRYPGTQAIAGTIKEVAYPTGGKTLFEFENNQILGDSTSYNTVQKDAGSFSQSTFGETSSSTFTAINNAMGIEITMSIHPISQYSVLAQLINVSNNKAIFSLTDLNVTSVGTYLGVNSNGTVRFKYTSTGSIAAGTYKWVIKITDNEGRNTVLSPTSISYTYYKNVNVTTREEKMVGGLRIKSITNYDKNGIMGEKWQYTYLNKAGKCSGIGAPEPQFVKSYVVTIQDVIPNVFHSPGYLGIDEIGETDLCRYTGSPIQYTHVTEEKLNGTLPSLKTDYEYSTREFRVSGASPIRGNGYNPVPYNPNDYAAGLLTAKTDYKYENGAYVQVMKERNTYDIIEYGDNIPWFRALSVTKYYLNPPDQMSYEDRFRYGTYEIRAAKVYLSSRQVETFSDSQSVLTTTNYSYNNPTYLQPSTSIQSKSGGATITKTYQYSFDDTSSVGIAMLDKNMISQPVGITTKNNNFTEQVTVQYGSFNSGTIIEPATVKQQQASSTTYNQIDYSYYDSYGNPLQVSRSGTNSTFYLWSYKGKYPVAEIKGGAYTITEIENAVNTAFGVGSINALSELEKPDENKLQEGKLQTALPGALVTTYTYMPQGGILTITNPTRLITRYEYDGFDRPIRNILRHKDASDNSVEKTIQFNDYHYQNQ